MNSELNGYIYDYLYKNNLLKTAQSFLNETQNQSMGPSASGSLPSPKVKIDTPKSYLFEWFIINLELQYQNQFRSPNYYEINFNLQQRYDVSQKKYMMKQRAGAVQHPARPYPAQMIRPPMSIPSMPPPPTPIQQQQQPQQPQQPQQAQQPQQFQPQINGYSPTDESPKQRVTRQNKRATKKKKKDDDDESFNNDDGGGTPSQNDSPAITPSEILANIDNQQQSTPNSNENINQQENFLDFNMLNDLPQMNDLNEIFNDPLS